MLLVFCRLWRTNSRDKRESRVALGRERQSLFEFWDGCLCVAFEDIRRGELELDVGPTRLHRRCFLELDDGTGMLASTIEDPRDLHDCVDRARIESPARSAAATASSIRPAFMSKRACRRNNSTSNGASSSASIGFRLGAGMVAVTMPNHRKHSVGL